MMFGLFGKEGKATEGGIMSLETVRCLAWTVIILFIMAIVFAFNHGPILAWLAANHTPLFAGIIQSPLWAVAFWLVILMLLCVIGIMDDDETPFAIGMHALGIMMCIGYWAGGAVFASHQPDDVTIYGLAGGFILSCLFVYGSWTGVGRRAGRRSRDCATRSPVSCSTMSRRRNTGGPAERRIPTVIRSELS